MRHLRPKRLIFSCFSLLSLLTLSACDIFARETPLPCPPIKIGVILAANTAEGLEQRLAYDFAQYEHRIHGCEFELLYEDEGDITDRESAQIAALELSEQNVIAILGGTSQQATMRIAGVARYLEIPLLAPLEGSDDLAEQNNPFVFQISPPQSAAAQASFSMLADSLGNQARVAILYEQSEYGESAAVAAGKAALQENLQIVAYQGFAAQAPDLTALSQVLISAAPSAIYMVSSNPEQALTLWQTMRASLATLTYFIGNGYGFVSQDFLFTSDYHINPDLNGLIIASAWNRDLAEIDFSAFEIKFRTYRQLIDRDFNEPITPRNIQSYAALCLLIDALNSVSLTNSQLGDIPAMRRMVVETLRNLNGARSIDSLLGPISFSPGGQNRVEQLLLQVVDDQLITVHPALYAQSQPAPISR